MLAMAVGEISILPGRRSSVIALYLNASDSWIGGHHGSGPGYCSFD
jgi:hypothetical protein